MNVSRNFDFDLDLMRPSHSNFT